MRSHFLEYGVEGYNQFVKYASSELLNESTGTHFSALCRLVEIVSRLLSQAT